MNKILAILLVAFISTDAHTSDHTDGLSAWTDRETRAVFSDCKTKKWEKIHPGASYNYNDRKKAMKDKDKRKAMKDAMNFCRCYAYYSEVRFPSFDEYFLKIIKEKGSPLEEEIIALCQDADDTLPWRKELLKKKKY